MGFLTYGQGLFWFDYFWEFEHLFLSPYTVKGSKVIPSPESNDVGISSTTDFGVILFDLSLFLLARRHTLTTCHPSQAAGSALVIHPASGTAVALDKPLGHQA